MQWKGGNKSVDLPSQALSWSGSTGISQPAALATSTPGTMLLLN